MKRISADKMHDGKKWLPETAVLEIDADGSIADIFLNGAFDDVQHFAGILCPGFVNAHCHTELSHMKGALPAGLGMTAFLSGVMSKRNSFSEEEKTQARQTAFDEIWRSGIVAIGDIANTADSLDLRAQGKMHFYTFVESIGFAPERAAASFANAEKLLQIFAEQAGRSADDLVLRQTIVPHAPYSVSEQLFQKIAEAQGGGTISVHNQECTDEDLLFMNKTGGFPEFLSKAGIAHDHFLPSGKTSLQTYMQWLSADAPLILVHNTCSSDEDRAAAESRFGQLFWCLCPSANLYIENKLPPVFAMHEAGLDICIGTDSLASNAQLSIVAELRVLHENFPEIGTETLLRWACSGGARALQMQDVVGSFAVGTRPGINLIADDWSVQKLY